MAKVLFFTGHLPPRGKTIAATARVPLPGGQGAGMAAPLKYQSLAWLSPTLKPLASPPGGFGILIHTSVE